MAKQETTMEKTNKYPKMIDKRLEQMRFSFADEHKVEAIAITFMPNIRYLTNFSGSSAILFILENEIHFVTDDRYEEQIKDELYDLPNMTIHITRHPWEYMVENELFSKVESMGFEADWMPYAEAVEIRNKIRPIKFKPATNLVTRFTQPKDPEELNYFKQSIKITEDTYAKMLEIIKPGMSEKEIAMELSYQARQLGSEGEPSEIIVISGPRCGIVNGSPSERKVKKNDIIIMDFGSRVNGFGSDISRTIKLGSVSKDQKAMYQILREAQKLAIKSVRPGMNGRHLDSIARNVIKKSGYGEYFKHDLGHGVGLRSVEEPLITPRSDSYMIPEDCIIGIEPGIYLPDKFGMRVEEVVLVTKSGGVIISNSPDQIEAIL